MDDTNGLPKLPEEMYAMHEKDKRDALSAASGKAVGYVDGSRLHELQEGRLNLSLWAEPAFLAGTPLYLHPATVTDEDVERALTAYMGARGELHECMRAALESFANKERE